MEMESIYSRIPPDQIPWNHLDPPEALLELLESKTITPCKTLDLGCGTGNYAIYLSKRGFDVTGVDVSPSAIRMAREKARREGVPCRFIVADILHDLGSIHESFDFIYDWEVLHHIYPEDRVRYMENVSKLLSRSGKYFSVCFNIRDPNFGGKGEYRTTGIGTTLYFSTLEEVRDLLQRFFDIWEFKTIMILGGPQPHIANYALSTLK